MKYSMALPTKPNAGADKGSTVVFCTGCPAQSNVSGVSCCRLNVGVCVFGVMFNVGDVGLIVCDTAAFALVNPKEAMSRYQTTPRVMPCPSKFREGLVKFVVIEFCSVLALKLKDAADKLIVVAGAI